MQNVQWRRIGKRRDIHCEISSLSIDLGMRIGPVEVWREVFLDAVAIISHSRFFAQFVAANADEASALSTHTASKDFRIDGSEGRGRNVILYYYNNSATSDRNLR